MSTDGSWEQSLLNALTTVVYLYRSKSGKVASPESSSALKIKAGAALHPPSPSSKESHIFLPSEVSFEAYIEHAVRQQLRRASILKLHGSFDFRRLPPRKARKAEGPSMIIDDAKDDAFENLCQDMRHNPTHLVKPISQDSQVNIEIPPKQPEVGRKVGTLSNVAVGLTSPEGT
jgi:hypothetical protein